MRTESLASSQGCRSIDVDVDAWCKWAVSEKKFIYLKSNPTDKGSDVNLVKKVDLPQIKCYTKNPVKNCSVT